MPFKSKAQQRFMFATMPKTAKKWAKKKAAELNGMIEDEKAEGE